MNYEKYTINSVKHEVPLIFSLIKNLFGGEDQANEFIKHLSTFIITNQTNTIFSIESKEKAGKGLLFKHVLIKLCEEGKVGKTYGSNVKSFNQKYIDNKSILLIDKCEFDFDNFELKEGVLLSLPVNNIFTILISTNISGNNDVVKRYESIKDIKEVALDNDLEIWQYTSGIDLEIYLFKEILKKLVF